MVRVPKYKDCGIDTDILYNMAVSRISGRRHPTRKQSATLMGSMGIVFLLFLSVLMFCPMVSANAASSSTNVENSDIIGIGECCLYLVHVRASDCDRAVDLGTTYVDVICLVGFLSD